MTALITTAIRVPGGAPEAARETLQPIRTDTPEAADSAPEYNELATERSGQLAGLAHSTVAPHYVEGQHYGNSYGDYQPADWTYRIDSQVSSSGTAARREEAGQFGHGTMPRTESMEPVIREGASLGGEYFMSNERNGSDLKGSYMTPVIADTDWNAVSQNIGTVNARKAFLSTQFDALVR